MHSKKAIRKLKKVKRRPNNQEYVQRKLNIQQKVIDGL